MVLVGLTGSIGSGKTTFADYIVGAVPNSGHWESWQLVAEVAAELRKAKTSPDPTDLDAINRWLKPLPDIIERICHKKLTFDQIKLVDISGGPDNIAKLRSYLTLMEARADLRTVPITKQNKEDFRSVLQWIGGYLALTCGGDIWYAELIRRIQAEKSLEVAVIGGVRFVADAICVQDAGGVVIEIRRPGLIERDVADTTERERSKIQANSVIFNDGTLGQLSACAKTLVHDLQLGALAKSYHAAKA